MKNKDSVSQAEVKTKLEGRRGDWPQLVERSRVSYSWISKFVNGRISNPGHQTLRKLRDALDNPISSRRPQR